MNTKSFVVAASVLLTSCSLMEVKVDEPITGKTIGLSHDINYEPKLCQNHIGLTIFNNYSKTYDLEGDLRQIIVDGYVRGIEQTGNKAQVLESAPYVYDDMTLSSWDASMTMSAEGKSKLVALGKEYNLDYILYSQHPPNINPEYRENKDGSAVCYGISLNTGGNYNIPLIPRAGTYLFDAKTGKHVGTIRLLNSALKVDSPKDHKNITREEIKYYMEMEGQFAEKSIVEFVNLSRNRKAPVTR